jgi:hypothetical protein
MGVAEKDWIDLPEWFDEDDDAESGSPEDSSAQ